jgi:TrwC relaxase
MHHGRVRWRQRRRGGSGGVVADIAKLSIGREAHYTRELATDHEQYLSGHGESPGRGDGAAPTTLGLQGEASPAGFQAMFEGRDPKTGDLLGRPHGRNAVPASDVVLRPTNGGVQHVSGQGVLAVGFDHRTSREGDPLLHTHLVVANRVTGMRAPFTRANGDTGRAGRRWASAVF